MDVYCFGGLGADARIFAKLDIPGHRIVPMDWIDLIPGDDLDSYSNRMLSRYNVTKPFMLLGVSFGGLLATTLAVNPNCVGIILVSSCPTISYIPRLLKICGHLGILKLGGKLVIAIPPIVNHYLFGAKNTQLLDEIILDTKPEFIKWALQQMANWNNEKLPERCLILHGSADRLIKPPKHGTIIIPGGQHFMIVDRVKEINSCISDYLSENSPR